MLLVAMLFAVIPASYAQNSSDEKTYESVEVAPSFKGGNSALMQFLQKNLQYPDAAVNAGEQGRAMVKFEVDTRGKIRDVTIIKSVSLLLDREATRVINSMPAWQAGMQQGKPVNCYFTLPVAFKLADTPEYDTSKSYAAKYEAVKHFPSKLIAVKSDSLWGIIDETGKELIPCAMPDATMKPFDIEIISDGFIKCQRKSGSWYAFNTKGSLAGYAEISNFRGNYARVWHKKKYGLVDKQGNVIVPLIYDDILTTPEEIPRGYFSEDGLVKVQLGKKYGLVDKTGKEVVPAKYDGSGFGWFHMYDFHGEDAYSFQGYSIDGFIKFKDGFKYGLFDMNGNEIASAKYDKIENVSEGLAIAITVNYYYTNKQGKRITPKTAEERKAADSNEENLYEVIDRTGKVIVPMGTYKYIGTFKDGKARVTKDGKSNVINTQGILQGTWKNIQ
ncbi:hypothetical protein FACS189429_1370 [Bacteroidia bacterium]|nr:hypothetical protein FACS189429_1370 [Bacteroidia bacterium]GHV45936.1 hypothetical protein FACS1894180_8750 [Bacteroidia bacterium]